MKGLKFYFFMLEAVPVRGGRVPEAVHGPQQSQEARQEPQQGGAGPVQDHQHQGEAGDEQLAGAGQLQPGAPLHRRYAQSRGVLRRCVPARRGVSELPQRWVLFTEIQTTYKLVPGSNVEGHLALVDTGRLAGSLYCTSQTNRPMLQKRA
jgi:hypothetical protein